MGLLSNIFGPSKDEIWSQLAAEINAEYVSGGFWKGALVRARVGEWTVTLDTYTVSTDKTEHTYTRLRAPYINSDGFRFKVYRASIFSGIGQAFGMQDIEIGQSPFDEDFVIQGSDEDKVCRLLSNMKTRQLIAAQPDICFEVKDDEGWFGAAFPDGVDELYFQANGVITDIEQLKQLFALFAEVLNHLCQIGSAYKKDPQVNL